MPKMEPGGSENRTRPYSEDLETFLAVVDEGGISAASRALGVPKSTINRRLGRLEATLDVRLLVRSVRRVSVTDAGARIVERTRDLLSDLDSVVDQAAGSRTEPAGRLRVSVADDLSAHTDVWLDFAEAHPRVELQVEFTNRYVDVLREGLDLALRGGPGEDGTLIARRVGTYSLRAVASPTWAANHGPLANPSQLRARDCVLLKAFRNQGPWQQGTRHTVVNDLWTATAAALRGLGIAILPRHLVDEHVDAGRLVPVLDAYDPLEVPLFAVYPNRRYLPSAAVAFLDHVAERFGGPG